MKAISTVIASILMLTIVIALGGTTYLYISGTFSSKIATSFEVIDSINDTVTIRNSGTEPITAFSSVTVDGTSAVYRVSTRDSSLVGYWKMDEGSSTIAYDSSQSNNGNLINTPTWIDGRFGKALDFDGSDHIDAGGSPTLKLTNDFTYEAWVKGDSLGSGARRAVMGNFGDGSCRGEGYGGINLDVDTAGRFWIRWGDSSGNYQATSVGPSPLNNNIWYHVVLVFDSSAGRIYVDGVSYSGSFTAACKGNRNFYIARNYNNGYYWDGIIDEVRVYNRALSEQEVNAHYNIGSQINTDEIATIKIYNILTKGTHTLRLCTSSICNAAYLTIT